MLISLMASGTHSNNCHCSNSTHCFGLLGEIAVSIHGDFTWNKDEAPFLKNISMDVAHGSLAVIVGSTGSGKSSITSAMLGLMQQV